MGRRRRIRITGKYSKIKLQNEVESLKAWQRERGEKETLILRQLTERQELQHAVRNFRAQRSKDIGGIETDIGEYLALKHNDLPRVKDFNEQSGRKDPGTHPTQRTRQGLRRPGLQPVRMKE